MEMLVVAVLVVIFVVVLAIKGFKIVQQAETMVIERLGRYHRTLDSGINVIWPMFDRPRELDWRYIDTDVSGATVTVRRRRQQIDLRETVYNFPKQNVITRDNVAIAIDALLYCQITDPVKAVYEIANLPDAIEKLTQTTLRNVIGELDLDDTLSSRDTINQRLRAVLDDATHKWGVKVNRVELQEISPPEDIRLAMEKQMRAERDRRASILEAEGRKQAQILEAEGTRAAEINRAEGQKQALTLVAEGEAAARIRVAQAEAEAITTVASAMSTIGGNPSTYLIAVRYIETLREMVSGSGNKVVYVPYEATAVLGSLAAVRDLFGGQDRGGSP